MKKIKIFICLLVTTAIAVNAQDNVVIRGYVTGSDTREPLSLCAVQIVNSALGALTDDAGFFELPIPKSNLKDSLKISFVGYMPQTLAIANFKQGDTLRIMLETQVLMKQEAVITAMNAKGVLLRAIQNLRKNLYRDSVIQTGFYRQIHKENGRYVRLIEADVNVAMNIKNPFTYSLHEMIQVNQQRRSENYETNGDIHGDHFVDLLKENPFSYNKRTFLNPRMLDFLAPKFDSEDSMQYVIRTQYKERSSAKLERAKIWVEKGSFAITRVEIEKFPNPYYVKTRYEIDSRWKLLNEKDVITLTKYQGKYLVSSLQRVYNHNVLNRETGVVDFIVEESFDLFFYAYQENNVGTAMQNGKYGEFTSFYTSHYTYNEPFWKNYDMIVKHPLPAQVKTDLEHAVTLEKQFGDSGK
jgi:hypothetical protein